MPFWSRPSAPPSPGTAAPPPGSLKCSFCGKSQADVRKLVAGPDVYICDECIALSRDIVEQDVRTELPPSPDAAAPLVEALEREVVGQPVACRAVGAALFRHLRGIRAERPQGPVRVLVVGPRGCGKTTLGRALCRPGFAGLPTYHADAGRLSETGYVGENVENLIGALLERSVDVEIGRRGILFLDALHHLVRQPPPPASRDVAGREAQRDLVRLLDGLDLVAVRQGRRHPQAPADPVACDRLMIVAAATLDVAAEDEADLRAALVEQGLVDETLSRFDVIVPMRRLSAADLRRVLDRQVASIRADLEALGASVELEDGAEVLAERAAGSPDGAFALLPPLSRLRERALLEAPRRWVLDRALASELLASRRVG